MADRYDNDRPDPESEEDTQSVFDLFEPPPPTAPGSFGKIPVIKDNEIDLTDATDAERQAAADAEAAGLQHWTAPPTGQVPAVLSEKDPKAGLWGDVAGPSWHGDDPTWSGPDLADVFADADSIRLDEYDDDEDDEEEIDDGFSRSASSANPIHRPPEPMRPAPSDPPLAAGPERRQPPASRSWPEKGVNGGNGPGAGSPERDPRDGMRAGGLPTGRSVPHPRPDPAPAPEPRPGAEGDRTTWPTSPETQPRRDLASPVPERPRLERPAAAQPEHRAQQTGDHPPRGLLSSASSETSSAQTGSIGDGQDRQAQRPSLFDEERSVPSIDDIEFADSAAASRGRSQPRTPLRQLERPAAEVQYDDEDDYDVYDEESGRASKAGRNVPVAIGVGAALVALLAGAMWLGPEMTLLLVVVAAMVGVVELYSAMRLAGLRPANLLGIVGTAAAPAAAFYRGDAGLPLIIGLTVVFGSLWYLVGADSERPVLNLSLTMMGIFWIGGLASFAGLMLGQDGGIDLLLAAIIITVVSDTMAYIGGRAYGRRPFHPASPNKTWEGTITGFLGAVFAGFAIGVLEMGSLWDGNFLPAVALGVIVGILAPIGDLTESVVKRDLGVKDMGHILPGHGGVLDRVDALLFALPGAYYLALVTGLI